MNKFPKTIVTAYTDGACKMHSKSRPSGWGFTLFYFTRTNTRIVIENYGGKSGSTNNEMEMTAMLECLKCIPFGSTANIYSDSAYVLGGFIGQNKFGSLQKMREVHYGKGWLEGWKRRGWKKSDGKSIENLDLWKSLDIECKRLVERGNCQLIFNWVKGHSGVEGNERADWLANKGAEDILNNIINRSD
jgi:ribonuclease HI